MRFSTDLVVKFDEALNSWVPNKSLSKNSDFRKSTKMRFFHLLLFFEACFCNERLGLSYSTLEKLFDEMDDYIARGHEKFKQRFIGKKSKAHLAKMKIDKAGVFSKELKR